MRVVRSAVVFAAMFFAASCGSPGAPAAKPARPSGGRQPATLTVTGTVEVTGLSLGAGLPAKGGGCVADTGYSDIPGAQVVVATDGGATLAVGSVQTPTGVFTATNANRNDPTDLSGRCAYSFEVEDVPAGKGYYSLAIGHRGSLKETEGELAQPLVLTLR